MNRVVLLLCILSTFASVDLAQPPVTVNVITFEELSVGTAPLAQYVSRYGVIVKDATVIDYATGGWPIAAFANSGTKAIEACFSQEFCRTPMEIRFTSPQTRISVRVGSSRPIPQSRTVVMVAFDGVDETSQEVARSTAPLAASTGFASIRVPLTVTSDSANIRRVRILYQDPNAFYNGLAVDDLEFDNVGPPPPCTIESGTGPSVSIQSPPSGTALTSNSFLLQFTVATSDQFATTTITVTSPGGTSTTETLPGFNSRFGPLWYGGALFPGSNTLAVAVRDCAGRVASARVTGITLNANSYWVPVRSPGIRYDDGNVYTGQVNALAVDARDSNIVYAGTAEGGLWLTRNAGRSWQPLTDGQLRRTITGGFSRGTSSIGAVAVDVQGTIYVGTGDPNWATQVATTSLGVFKSADGGLSWTAMGKNFRIPSDDASGCQNSAMSTARVSSIIIRPGSPNAIFAGTDVGLFRYLEDGNDCWQLLPVGRPSPTSRWIDLVMDPIQLTLYAGLSGQGVYRSTNATATQWTPSLVPPFPFDRIALAISRSQPNILYAGFDARNPPGDPEKPAYALYTTISRVPTWTRLPSPPANKQLEFNNVIAVNPMNPNDVYLGQVGLWRTTDGGRNGGLNNLNNRDLTGNSGYSWTPVGGNGSFVPGLPPGQAPITHADHHAIVFALPGSYPASLNVRAVLYVAHDGGVSRGMLAQDGRLVWQNLNANLPIAQLGDFSLIVPDPDELTAGVWHNGTIYMDVNVPYAWSFWGGDGWWAWSDPLGTLNATLYFNCNAGGGGGVCRAQFNRATRRMLPGTGTNLCDQCDISGTDPFRQGTMFLRLNGKLYRTQEANSVAAKSLDNLSNWREITPARASGNVTAVAAQRDQSGTNVPIYYVGTDKGEIFRGSPEAGWGSGNVCAGCPPSLRVCRIWVDAGSVDRVLALADINVFPNGTPNQNCQPGQIWKVRRSSSAWSAANTLAGFSSLLQINEFHAAAADPADPNTIYVGTDQGMYDGRRAGSNWTWTRSPGIPDVTVMDIQVHQNASGPTGIIRAATYGRGVYELRKTPARRGVPADGVAISTRSAVQLQLRSARGVDGHQIFSGVQAAVVDTNTGERVLYSLPVTLTLTRGSKVVVEVPGAIRAGAETLELAATSQGDNETVSGTRFPILLDDDTVLEFRYDVRENIPATLTISAIQTDLDGAPNPVSTHVTVAIGNSHSSTVGIPGELRMHRGSQVVLEAPATIKLGGTDLRFLRWAVDGEAAPLGTKLSVTITDSRRAVACYVGVEHHVLPQRHPRAPLR